MPGQNKNLTSLQTPGPASYFEYDGAKPNHAKQSSVFVRPSMTHKKDMNAPGPGSYDPKIPTKPRIHMTRE